MLEDSVLLTFSFNRRKKAVTSLGNTLLGEPLPFEDFFAKELGPASLPISDPNFRSEELRLFLLSAEPGGALSFASTLPGGKIAFCLTQKEGDVVWVEVTSLSADKESPDFDFLTSVHSRPYFFKKAAQSLLRFDAADSDCYLLMIDLDNFKGVNDSYGHIIGDLYLKSVASILQGIFKDDLFARYGGDEFVALLVGVTPEQLAGKVEEVGRVSYSYSKVSARTKGVTCSVGVAKATGRGSDLISVLEQADEDLYRKKKSRKGKAFHKFFSSFFHTGKKKKTSSSLLLYKEERSRKLAGYILAISIFLFSFLGATAGIDFVFNAQVKSQTEGIASSLMASESNSIAGTVSRRSSECFLGLKDVTEALDEIPYQGQNNPFVASCLLEMGKSTYIGTPGLLLESGNALFQDGVSYDFSYSPIGSSAFEKDTVSRVSFLFQDDQIVFAHPYSRAETSETDGKLSIVAVLSLFSVDEFAQELNLDAFESSFFLALALPTGDVVVERRSASYPGLDSFSNLADAFSFSGMEEESDHLLAQLSKEGSSLRYSSYNGGTYFYLSPLGVGDWRLAIVAPYSYFNAYLSSFSALISVSFFSLSAVFILAFVICFAVIIKSRMDGFDGACIDPVTGTLNDIRFLQDAGRLRRRKAGSMAIVALNIRGFKSISERLGTEGGNALLSRIASLLQAQMGNEELLCRMMGDRFIMLLPIESEESLSNRVEEMIYQIDSNLPKESHLSLIWSGGASLLNPASSVRVAVDQAISACKKATTSWDGFRLVYFDSGMKKATELAAYIAENQENALASGQFIVYYQPKYDLKKHCFGGMEALVRWKDPEKGFLNTQAFVDVFEENGFITKLDLYVFETVLSDLRFRFESNQEVLPVSINLSRVHFLVPNFFSQYEELIRRYGIPGRVLEFEITESVALNSGFDVNSLCKRIHALGAKVSIDDFGSGFSNLSLINHIDYDILKLDRKLLFGKNGFDEDSRRILKMVVELNAELGKKSVCEGVEEKKESDFLSSVGCDLIQGYYYGKPMPKLEALQWIKKKFD